MAKKLAIQIVTHENLNKYKSILFSSIFPSNCKVDIQSDRTL